MANFVANSQLFIPFSDRDERPNYGEDFPRQTNFNDVDSVFDGTRVKRQKHGSEPKTHGTVPWKKRESYSRGVVGLHEEINDFYDVMSPLQEEKEIRHVVIKHIEHIVLSMWPHAKVEVFGSFNTGLFLPTSDIDVVVSGEWSNLPLHTLKAALIRNGIDQNDIEILSNATVPIVRLLHTPTKVKVDISFNVANGIRSAELIKNSMQQYPELPKLVLVLKQFLLHRHLNEVYYGGMSSYTLTLLVLSFLQGPHKPKSVPTTNMGTMLMEFFELYGINFNYENVAISVRDGGYYYPKTNIWGSFHLSIEDPHCIGNDIAKGTYSILVIKNSFENAYNCLHKALTDSQGDTRQGSLLRLILDVDPSIIVQRNWTVSKFSQIIKRLPPVCVRDLEKDSKENNVDNYPLEEQRVQVLPSTKSHDAVQRYSSMENKSYVRPQQKTMIFYATANQSRNARNFSQSHYGESSPNKAPKRKQFKRPFSNSTR